MLKHDGNGHIVLTEDQKRELRVFASMIKEAINLDAAAESGDKDKFEHACLVLAGTREWLEDCKRDLE